MQSSSTPNSVEGYIAQFPIDIQATLRAIREAVKKAAPNAVEAIAYGMPAYKYKKKPIAYFATFSNHIGFYATPNAHQKFADRLAGYKQGKGSVQFPISQEMPLELIADMIQFNYDALGR